MTFAEAGEQFEYILIHVYRLFSFFLFEHQCGGALHIHSEMLRYCKFTSLQKL